MSRADLRQVIAATYHQVWWPAASEIKFTEDYLPVWDQGRARYVDPAIGELVPSWDDALDAIGQHDEPLHVARSGTKFDAQGVLPGSRDSARSIGYLTKYLVKDLGHCHQADTGPQRDHARRLTEALRYEPCSPTCANWLRYGITPKNPRKGLTPGACKGKAHQPDHLGYAGRRVLVSRRWSGKTLADHRADRKAWLLDTLGLPDVSATEDRARYHWERVSPADPDYLPPRAASSASSPNGCAGSKHSTTPDASPKTTTQNFRQPGGLHDGAVVLPAQGSSSGAQHEPHRCLSVDQDQGVAIG